MCVERWVVGRIGLLRLRPPASEGLKAQPTSLKAIITEPQLSFLLKSLNLIATIQTLQQWTKGVALHKLMDRVPFFVCIFVLYLINLLFSIVLLCLNVILRAPDCMQNSQKPLFHRNYLEQFVAGTFFQETFFSLSTRWLPGAHISEIGKAHFQIGAVFINKLQIWVLNNYILTWNTLKTTFHDTITVIFWKWCK